MERRFAGQTFECVGPIRPERDSGGALIESRPESAPSASLHRYGKGPFCRFRIAQESRWQRGGVHVITCDNDVRYVGESRNLAQIWNFGGRISPSAVLQDGGRQTHCRINNLILTEAKQGTKIVVWFHSIENHAVRKERKAQLISALAPPWNLTRS